MTHFYYKKYIFSFQCQNLYHNYLRMYTFRSHKMNYNFFPMHICFIYIVYNYSFQLTDMFLYFLHKLSHKNFLSLNLFLSIS